jgi:uncharacterized protein with PIN domain
MIVVDSSALIAILEEESGAATYLLQSNRRTGCWFQR